MKKILAVSGGMDSMVMLDWFAKKCPTGELVVASFDHGTRESGARDVDFVAEVCSALKIRFYRGKIEKSKSFLSEEEARKERYNFLFKVAFEERGEVYVAQYLEDLVESICINLIRGTGFRGLAPMTRWGVRRPFLEEDLARDFLSTINSAEARQRCASKANILGYAAKERVAFREDPTNNLDDYLRNRIRKKVREMDSETKMAVFKLWQKQKKNVREIEQICENLVPEDLRFEREMFRKMPAEVGEEVLREGLLRAGCSATRVQRREFLRAILEYLPGKSFNLPSDKLVKIHKDFFQL